MTSIRLSIVCVLLGSYQGLSTHPIDGNQSCFERIGSIAQKKYQALKITLFGTEAERFNYYFAQRVQPELEQWFKSYEHYLSRKQQIEAHESALELIDYMQRQSAIDDRARQNVSRLLAERASTLCRLEELKKSDGNSLPLFQNSYYLPERRFLMNNHVGAFLAAITIAGSVTTLPAAEHTSCISNLFKQLHSITEYSSRAITLSIGGIVAGLASYGALKAFKKHEAKKNDSKIEKYQNILSSFRHIVAEAKRTNTAIAPEFTQDIKRYKAKRKVLEDAQGGIPKRIVHKKDILVQLNKEAEAHLCQPGSGDQQEWRMIQAETERRISKINRIYYTHANY